MPLTVWVALWGDDFTRQSQDDPERQLALLNERRAAKGKPPLTMEEAQKNQREFEAKLKKGRHAR